MTHYRLNLLGVWSQGILFLWWLAISENQANTEGFTIYSKSISLSSLTFRLVKPLKISRFKSFLFYNTVTKIKVIIYKFENDTTLPLMMPKYLFKLLIGKTKNYLFPFPFYILLITVHYTCLSQLHFKD